MRSVATFALAGALLTALAFTAPQVAPPPGICDVNLTATGGARYRVLTRDDSTPDSVVSIVSEHTQLYAAIERAQRVDTDAPALVTWIDHEFYLRVECPMSTPDPDPVPDSSDVVSRVCVGAEIPVRRKGEDITVWLGDPACSDDVHELPVEATSVGE